MGRLGRRRFVTALGATALVNPFALLVQGTSKVPRLGALDIHGVSHNQSFLKEALGRAGYTVGRNIFLEWSSADEKLERLPYLADDLVRRNVDVIVCFGGVEAVARATRTVPIVMAAYAEDPVKKGLAESLARPGGNVTGTTWAPDLIAMVTKQYEVLKEAVSTAERVASLWTPWAAGAEQLADEIHDRVRKGLGLIVTSFVPREPEEFPSVLDRIATFKPDALYVCHCPIVEPRFGEVAIFAVRQKLVALANSSSYVMEGGLLSYGIDLAYIFDRTVSFVDRILHGARPADLPIEQPEKFELLFNAKAARAMGYTLPPQLQIRVDRVIE